MVSFILLLITVITHHCTVAVSRYPMISRSTALKFIFFNFSFFCHQSRRIVARAVSSITNETNRAEALNGGIYRTSDTSVRAINHGISEERRVGGPRRSRNFSVSGPVKFYYNYRFLSPPIVSRRRLKTRPLYPSARIQQFTIPTGFNPRRERRRGERWETRFSGRAGSRTNG